MAPNGAGRGSGLSRAQTDQRYVRFGPGGGALDAVVIHAACRRFSHTYRTERASFQSTVKAEISDGLGAADIDSHVTLTLVRTEEEWRWAGATVEADRRAGRRMELLSSSEMIDLEPAGWPGQASVAPGRRIGRAF